MNPSNAKTNSPKKIVLTALAGFLALLFVACLYLACFRPLAGNIHIGGVEVGGLTVLKAHRALKQELGQSLLQQPLTVQLPEESLKVSPEDCDLRVHMGKLLLDAMWVSPNTSESLYPYLSADTAQIRKKLEDYAARYDTVLTQPSWQLEGEAPDLSTEVFDPNAAGQTLAVTLGVPAAHLNIDAVLEEMMRAFSDAVTLCREGRYQIAPNVPLEAIPGTPDAAAIAGKVEHEPVEDSVDRDSFSFVHGSYGTAVDRELLAQKILGASYGETVTVPVQYISPRILGEAAYFQDILGAYETRHTNDQNRNANLQLQCDTLNGLVLQPGEVFSMNGVLGERTIEKGYKPAPAYSGNRLVNSPGGGVCQGTTTLYNCVLLADLEVVFRACHGVSVGYVPLGLDAAVNFLTTDFQFRNNFNFPIQLRAWMEDEYVKMQILGTDEKDYYIKMETGSGEDEYAYYARSYKCKYSKETGELISRDVEAFSTYYKEIG